VVLSVTAFVLNFKARYLLVGCELMEILFEVVQSFYNVHFFLGIKDLLVAKHVPDSPGSARSVISVQTKLHFRYLNYTNIFIPLNMKHTLHGFS
jgi:hypothetical protein